MRIGVFGIRDIPSTYSGYETFATTLLPELARRGHEVVLYTRHEESGGSSYHGVERRYLPSIRTKQLDTLSHGAISAVRSRFGHHDVVLSFNVANAFFLPALTLTGVPTVLNVDGQEWLRGKWGRVGRGVFRGSARLSRFAATHLVTDCNAMAEVYRTQFGADTTVIPYCWAPATDLGSSPVSPPSSFGLRDGFFVTGGRLVPENNIHLITRSFANTPGDFQLAVLGEANYDSPVTRELRELAAADSRIHLLGHISDRSTFFGLLRGARAYLHGHSVGGINPSMIEAMGAGAVIAAFDTPFNREPLGGHGLYFRDAASAFPDVLAQLERLPVDPAVLREGARDTVAGAYTVADVSDAYEAALQATVDRRARSIDTKWSRERVDAGVA